MNRPIPVLEGIRVASPCTVSWEGMKGDDRVRHCGECRLNVYNLSAMSRREAEALVAGKEGRLCVRFYRREDGTVLTQDCPVGLRAVRRRLALIGGALAAMFLGMFAAGCGRSSGTDGTDGGDGVPVPTQGPDPGPSMGIAAPPETQGRMVTPPRVIMGDVADPPALQGEVHIPETPAPPR